MRLIFVRKPYSVARRAERLLLAQRDDEEDYGETKAIQSTTCEDLRQTLAGSN